MKNKKETICILNEDKKVIKIVIRAGEECTFKDFVRTIKTLVDKKYGQYVIDKIEVVDYLVKGKKQTEYYMIIKKGIKQAIKTGWEEDEFKRFNDCS